MKKLRVVAMIELVAPPEPQFGFRNAADAEGVVREYLERNFRFLESPGRTVHISVASEEIEDNVRPAA